MIPVKAHQRFSGERKKEIKRFIKHSIKEEKKFSKKRDEIHLMQAGEKVWRAYADLIKFKLGVDIQSTRGRRYFAKKMGLKGLYRDVYLLHSYYYSGAGDPEMIRDVLKESRKQILEELKEKR